MSPLLELKHPLILGSSSPRRQDMLKSLRIPFKSLSPQTAESRHPNEAPEDYVRRNCLEKTLWVSHHQKLFPRAWILCADTIVVLGEEVLEKPHGPAEARAMLEKLSGRIHEVLSAFCIYDTQDGEHTRILRLVTTAVKFRHLSPQDINFYLSTQEPFDKAGAYGIQGVGGFLIEKIEGSYSNVVGLPLAELLEELRRINTAVPLP